MDNNENFRFLHAGLPKEIRKKKEMGKFAEAVTVIDRYLTIEELDEAMRKSLQAQREMILRLPLDYPWKKEEAIQEAKKVVPDFTEEEFEHLEEAGKIDWICQEGEIYYFDRFMENLCKTEESYAKRAGKGADWEEKSYFAEAIQQMHEQGETRRKFLCRHEVKIKDTLFEKGKRVRVYLPLPCACDSQTEICIEEAEPKPTCITSEGSGQRVIFWEEVMEEQHPFSVTFSYIRTARYQELEEQNEGIIESLKEKNREIAGTVQGNGKGAVCENDLEEYLPHIAFTPYIRELVQELTKDVETPLEKARCIYDFVTTKVRYSFMPAYFSMENIAENAARNRVGDCGVQTLLFITMCRCAGIPARWESGWAAEPEFCGAHDWARFYVEDYGWLYADPSYGGDAFARGDEKRRRHYFGNLDPFRMTANTVFQGKYEVPKEGWRADPYDNQVGEIEIEDRGLRYDEFERAKRVLRCEEM